MADLKISVGGTDVVFRKSDSLVAIKRKPGPPTDVGSLAALTAKSPAQGEEELAGFELREITSESKSPQEVLQALRQNDAIADGTEVFYTSDDQVPFVPTGQIYVEFGEGATEDQIHAILDDQHLAVQEARDLRTLILMTTPASPAVMDVVAKLQSLPEVKVAEPDLATFGQLKGEFAFPVEEFLKEQWHLRNEGFHRNTSIGFLKGADARVLDAWKHLNGFGRPDVLVAVIDDGFDLKHPDIGGVHKVVAPKDFTRNSADPSPDWTTEDWHGTACAGVAVGSMNGKLIVGAAPASRLMPVRWGPNLSDSQLEAWFDWVREQGAWVVSCSWGAKAKVFALSTRAKSAIKKCAEQGRGGKGTVICFAAGNSNHNVNNPPNTLDGFAIHPNVIAVAACTSRDQRSDYSNFGREIWVCAPSSGAGGWGITTSDVSGTVAVNGTTFELGYDVGPVTHDFGGTSSACPLVAGICALILSANPDLTAPQVREILRLTARKIGDPKQYNDGHSHEFGYGCVNALEAVQMATGAVPSK